MKVSCCRKFKSQSAFTVFELIVTISLSAIVAVVAIPRFSDINSSMQRMNVRNNLLLDLRRAQAESVTQGCRGIFKIAPNFRSYTFGCDYLDYDTAIPPSADNLIFSRTLPTNFFINADKTIIFNSKGQITDEYNFIDSRSVTLSDNASGPTVVFAQGQVLGTGLFEYE